MRYLVDTNVFSEGLKRMPSEPVLRWLRENESSLCISVITVAEIRRGIERLPEKSGRREKLQQWLSAVCDSMRGNVLGLNRSVAHVWGQMQARLDRSGLKLAAFDGLLAATAVRHDLTLVTRNVADFKNAPVKILNPFDED